MSQSRTHLEASLPGIHFIPGTGSCCYTIYSGRAVDIARLQEHVDHDVVQVCIGAADPLGNDEDAQVPKKSVQEDHLRDKFADDGQLVTEVPLIEQ